jgi:hypothetical protein
LKNEIKIARITTIIIFIALIRTLSEPFRLQYYSDVSLSFSQVKPFLLAGVVSAVGLFAMILFYFYGKYKVIIAIGILIIVTMIIIKFQYGI